METAENPDNGGGVAAALDLFIRPMVAGQVDRGLIEKLKAGKA